MITFEVDGVWSKLTVSKEEKPLLKKEAGRGVSYHDIALGIIAILAIRSMGKQAQKEIMENLNKGYKEVLKNV
jgi:hypothetical protein